MSGFPAHARRFSRQPSYEGCNPERDRRSFNHRSYQYHSASSVAGMLASTRVLARIETDPPAAFAAPIPWSCTALFTFALPFSFFVVRLHAASDEGLPPSRLNTRMLGPPALLPYGMGIHRLAAKLPALPTSASRAVTRLTHLDVLCCTCVPRSPNRSFSPSVCSVACYGGSLYRPVTLDSVPVRRFPVLDPPAVFYPAGFTVNRGRRCSHPPPARPSCDWAFVG